MAGLGGWGGRIRTSVWRNQNPLPYCLELRRARPSVARSILALCASRHTSSGFGEEWTGLRVGTEHCSAYCLGANRRRS
jgi:hypothetical protein